MQRESIIGTYKLDKFRMNSLKKIPCGKLRSTLGILGDTSSAIGSSDPGLVNPGVVEYVNKATKTCLGSCSFDGCELKDRKTRARQKVLPPIV